MTRAIGALGLLVLLVGACRSSTVTPTEAAEARIEQGVADGFEAADKAEATVFEVRHNPAACECPPFEVFAYGRWIRTFIDANTSAQTNLANLRNGDTLAVTKVSGRVEQKPRAAANGVQYLVLTAL